MPKCPNCKQILDHLICYITTINTIKLVPGSISYIEDQVIIDTIKKYLCPNCARPIASGITNAVKFLKED